jgi:hypothetical protein
MSEAISSSSRAGSIERSWTQWGAIAVVAALVADVLFNVNVSDGENGGTGPMLGVGAALVVVGVGLYGYLFPKVSNAAKGALLVGIAAAVLIVAFWSGVQLLLLPAAYVFFRRDPGSTAARVGLGLAGIAAALDAVAALSNAL